MDNNFKKFTKAYFNVINETVDEEDELDDIQYAILNTETEEVVQFGDNPAELMEIIDTNEQEGIWEEGVYGVYERQGDDGDWEICEVVSGSSGMWR